MGALFELLAELLVAITLTALAQFGVFTDAGREQPSIERTILRTPPQAAATKVTHQDCEERADLQSA